LYVQYRAASGEWKTIKRHDAETGELPVRSFRRFEFTLPVNKLPNGNLEIRFNYRHDTSWKDYWVIDDFEIEDGRRLQPLDGRFGEESSETVNLTGIDATDVTADLSSYPEGINVTYGIQFRDTTAQRYWGPMGTDWLVVDTSSPDPPDSFGFTSNYTQRPVVDMSFDFIIFPRYRPGLFRFSCSSNGPWSQWKVYDLDKSLYQKGPFRSEIPVNLTNTNAGCVTDDGNKTIYVQGRDFANNSVTVGGSRWTGSDWIVLDRYAPNMTDHAPDNMSHINGTQNITVNATDFRPQGVGTVSGVSREKEQQFFNGSSEGRFTANKSFDPGYNTNILQGLVGFWRMDRTSGKALDYSGNQNHGTVSGATRGVQGILGTQAFRFDGSNERVEVPDSPALNVNDTDRLTISLWVRSLSSDSGFRDMLDKSNSYLFYLNNRKPTLVLYTAGDWVSITASKRVNTGAWHHLVAQYNGTHLRLFINGKLNKQKQVSITGIQGSATKVFLGNYPSLGYPCKCRLDEARVYDRELPRSQIRNLYSGPHPLLVTLFDRAANSRQRYLQYFLDFNQPRLTSVQPRTRVVPQGGQISLTLFDLASNVSHVGLYNETAWVMNSTRQQVRTTVTLTEPWTAEGDHNLTLWANDSVGHV
ncbi:MAG: LamG domain-containing protein, partial [Candidatus Nanohaloarchaea archaeon]|nr:LamG domain-containing protein [Candidatus Nanohaloarchaea archaeon]